jgi:hypothetical protein
MVSPDHRASKRLSGWLGLTRTQVRDAEKTVKAMFWVQLVAVIVLLAFR